MKPPEAAVTSLGGLDAVVTANPPGAADERVEAEPSLLGASSHLLAVAQR